jgi:hypothetical protein
MFRRRKDEPVARLGRETDVEAEALHDACALACLTRIADILAAYELAPKVLDSREVDDRAVDLWAPLLALAMVADAEAGGDRAERILMAARTLSDAREADDEAGSAARLITALQKVAAEVGFTATPTRLLEALQANGYAWVKSTRRLAGLLAPLGLVARPGRENGRPVRLYTLDSGALADLARRYNPAVGAAGDDDSPSLSKPVESVNNRQQASTAP